MLDAARASLRETQRSERIDAKDNDQHGLDGVYDEYEVEGMDVSDSIENEHGLDGKVPRSGTVRRRNDDGNGSDDEGHHRTAYSQVCREVEAEECQVVVEEVADPDSQCEEDKEWYVLYVLQRDDPLPDAFDGRTYLIIYRQFS